MMLPKINEADFIADCARARRKRLARFERPAHIPARKPNRNHSKRHSENKERSYRDRAKAAKAKKAQQAYITEYKRRSAIMRAYFAGEIADLSAL